MSFNTTQPGAYPWANFATGYTYFNPRGLGYSPSLNLLYVADCGTHNLMTYINLTTNRATVFGGVGISSQGNVEDPVTPGMVWVANSGGNAVSLFFVNGSATQLNYAGTGVQGWRDGPRALAQFNNPYALAWCASVLFIVDYGNNRLRAMSSGGVVTTAAGSGAASSLDGVGQAAGFDAPMSVVCDPFSTAVLVMEYNGQRISAYTPATGAVVTYKGGLNNLQSGLGVDTLGDILVAGGVAKVIYSLTNKVQSPNIGNGAGNLLDGCGTAAGVESPTNIVGAAPGVSYFTSSVIRRVTCPVVSSSTTPSPSPTPQGPPPTPTLTPVPGGGCNLTTLAGSPQQCSSTTPMSASPAALGGALLGSVWGVAINASGAVFFSDTMGGLVSPQGKVRVVTLGGGGGGGVPMVFDVAGTISTCTDGMPVNNAGFKAPRGMALDVGGGSLIVADGLCNNIRRVSFNGNIAPIAGSVVGAAGYVDGVGSLARFSGPSAVALDGAGNIYVADTSTLRIRVVAVGGSAMTTTLAGTGVRGTIDGAALIDAAFNSPMGIAVSSDGSQVYVCDFGGHTIRGVWGGFVRTLAGSPRGTPGFSDGVGVLGSLFTSPTSLLLNEATGTLLISDFPHIRTLSLATLTTGTLAGIPSPQTQWVAGSMDGPALASSLNLPRGMAFRPGDGALVITDSNNCLLRALVCPPSPSPTPSSSPGTSPTATPTPTPSPPATPAPLAGGSSGSGGANCVLSAFPLNGFTSGGPNPSFQNPRGLALSNDGTTLLVADAVNHMIKVVNVSTGSASTLAGLLAVFSGGDGAQGIGAMNQPSSLLLLPGGGLNPSATTGTLLVADSSLCALRNVSLSTGFLGTVVGGGGSAYVDSPLATAVRYMRASSIALAPNGVTVLVADGPLLRATNATNGATVTLCGVNVANGPVDGVCGPATPARIQGAFALAIDPVRNNAVFLDAYCLRVMNLGGVVGGPIGVPGPLSLWTLAGGGRTGFADGPGPTAQFALSGPSNLALDGAGNVYTADNGNNRIRFTLFPSGFTTTLIGTGVRGGFLGGIGSAALNFPSGLVLMPGGAGVGGGGPSLGVTLIVCDTGNNVLRWLTCSPLSPSPTPSPGSSRSTSPTPSPTATPSPPPSPLSPPFATNGCTVSTVVGGFGGCAPGIAWDPSSKSLFIADTCFCILRVMNSAGVLSSLAGSTGAAYANGVGAVAKFNGLNSLAVNSSGGVVLIADAWNSAVRATVIATGETTLFAGRGAGGPPGGADGPAGTFGKVDAVGVQGIATNAGGTLVFVCDTVLHRIRGVSPIGVLSTLAGTGVAGWGDGPANLAAFSSPSGLALAGGASSLLYVADSGNHRIRVISGIASLGGGGSGGGGGGGVIVMVSTLAGSGAAGYGDGLGTTAAFFMPVGLALNNPLSPTLLYVADVSNTRIRTIALPSGLVGTLAGQPWTGGGNPTDGPVSMATFLSPTGLAVNASGVFVGDGPRVRFISCPATPGSPTLSPGSSPTRTPTPPSTPTFTPTSNPPPASASACTLSTLAGSGSPAWRDGNATTASFNVPFGLAVSPAAGVVLVADSLNNILRGVFYSNGTTFTLSGYSTTAGGTDGAPNVAQYSSPFGVTLVPGGASGGGVAYVADWGSARIRRVFVVNGSVTTYAGSSAGHLDGAFPQFDRPSSVTGPDAWGTLYVSETSPVNAMWLRRVYPNRSADTLSGARVGGYADGPCATALFNHINGGLALDPGTGRLYVADVFNSVIRVVTGANPTSPGPCTVATFAGVAGVASFADGTGSSALFINPMGIALDTAGGGRLLVADAGAHCIRAVNLATRLVSTLIGGVNPGAVDGPFPVALLNGPRGVALLPSGAIVIADTNNHKLRLLVCPSPSLTPTPTASRSMGTTPLPTPSVSPTVSPTPRLTPTPSPSPRGCTLTTAAGSPNNAGYVEGVGTAARFSAPGGIAADANFIYISDTANHRIRAVALAGPSTTTNLATSLLAGCGVAAYVEGSNSTNSCLSSPYGLAVDASSGRLFIADLGNNRIRLLFPNATMTTLCGNGLAATTDGTCSPSGGTAAINQPYALALSPLDGTTLYVVTLTPSLVRMVTSTAGGVGVACLTVAGGSGGNGDGLGTAASFNARGIVITPDATALYIADISRHTVRRVALPSGAVTTVAGGALGYLEGTGTGALFNNNQCLGWGSSVGGGGVLLVCDNNNYRVRSLALDQGGATATVVGTGLTAQSGVGGVYRDGWVPSFATLATPSGVVALSGNLSGGWGIVDSMTCTLRILWCPASPSPTPSVTPSAGSSGSTTPIPSPTPSRSPSPFTPSPTPSPSSPPPCTVSTLLGATATTQDVDGTGAGGLTLMPMGLAYSPAQGALLITDRFKIRAATIPGGVLTTLVGPSTGSSGGFSDGLGSAASFQFQFGVAVAGDWEGGTGSIFTMDTLGCRVRRTLPPANCPTCRGWNFTTSPWAGGGSCSYVDAQGTNARFAPNAAASGGVVVMPGSGNLVVGDWGNGRLRAVTPTGAVSTYAGSGLVASVDGVGTGASFNLPGALAVDGAGNIVVLDWGSSALRIVYGGLTVGSGVGGGVGGPVVVTGAGCGLGAWKDGVGTGACFSSPAGAAFDAFAAPGGGLLYVSDSGTHLIRAVHCPSLILPTAPGGVPLTLASAASPCTVSTLAGRGGLGAFQDGPAAAAAFNRPWGLAVTGLGQIYVVDNQNHRIRSISCTSLPSGMGGSGAAAAATPHPLTASASPTPGWSRSASPSLTPTPSPTPSRLAPSCWVSTLAGGGLTPWADGTGTSAQFSGPSGLAGNAGNGVLMVSEAGSSSAPVGRLRAVMVGGGGAVVQTLVGSTLNSGGLGSVDATTGAFSLLNTPGGVAVDGGVGGSGNVYLCDTGNAVLRRVNSVGGGVVTLAGRAGVLGWVDGIAGAARFSQPIGCTLSGDGATLYVSDVGSHTIRRYGVGSGVVSTLGGSGAGWWVDGVGTLSSFNAPMGMALSPDGTRLFIADSLNCVIRSLSLATRAVTTLAGQPGVCSWSDSANPVGVAFRSPTSCTLWGPSLLLVTDGHGLRVVNLGTGGSATLAGTPAVAGSVDGPSAAATFNAPKGVMVMGGVIYVADGGNNKVRQLVCPTLTATPTPSATPSLGFTPSGTPSPSPSLTLTPTGATPSPSPSPPPCAVSTLVGRSGVSFNPSLDGVGLAAGLLSPGAMAVDPSGEGLVFVDSNRIRSLGPPPTLTVSTLAGPPGAFGYMDGVATMALFNAPSGICSEPGVGGRVLITESGNHALRALAGGVVTTLAGCRVAAFADSSVGTTACFNEPRGCVVVGSVAYLTDFRNNRIRTVALGVGTSNAVSSLAGRSNTGYIDGQGSAAAFYNPSAITVDPTTGNLWVGDFSNKQVRCVTPGGMVTTPRASYTLFGNPMGLAVSPDGASLYISGGLSHTLTILSLRTFAATTLGTGANADVDGPALAVGSPLSFSSPFGLAILPSFSGVFIAETWQNLFGGAVIRLLSCPSATGSSSNGTSPSPSPSLTFSPSQQAAPLLPLGPCTTTSLAGSASTTGIFSNGIGALATFSNPSGVVAAGDASGAIAIGDRGNNRVRLGVPSSVVYGSVAQLSVSTLAGTGAASCGFNLVGFAGATMASPTALGLGPGGTFFVADTACNRILTLTFSGQGGGVAGESLFAGSPGGLPGFLNGPRTGGAQLQRPEGLVWDPVSGALYVGDTGNNAIRVVWGGEGSPLVTLVGGGPTTPGYADSLTTTTGSSGVLLNAPRGLALSPDGATLYCADTSNNVVRSIATGTGFTQTLAGSGQSATVDGVGTLAAFQAPYGLSLLVPPTSPQLQFLAVSDSGSNRVRLISLAGPGPTMVTTLSGTGAAVSLDSTSSLTASHFTPRGIAVDFLAEVVSLLVTDGGSGLVRRITCPNPPSPPPTTSSTPTPTRSPTPTPSVPPSGSTPPTPSTTPSPSPQPPSSPISGCSLATLAGTGTPGSADNAVAPLLASFTNPGALAWEPSSGVLYVLDTGSHKLRGVVMGGGGVGGVGSVYTVAGTGTPGFLEGYGANSQFNSPSGLVLASPNLMYVSDSGNHRIRRVSLPLGGVNSFAGSGAPSWVDGLGLHAGFNTPIGLALGTLVVEGQQQQVLLVADTINCRVRSVTLPNSAVVTTLGGIGVSAYIDGPALTTAAFFNPRGVATSSSGSGSSVVYIADGQRMRVLEGGVVSTLVDGSGGTGSVQSPPAWGGSLAQLVFDSSSQSLLVADTLTGRVRSVTLGVGLPASTTTLVGSASVPVGTSVVVNGPALSSVLSSPRGVAVVTGVITSSSSSSSSSSTAAAAVGAAVGGGYAVFVADAATIRLLTCPPSATASPSPTLTPSPTITSTPSPSGTPTSSPTGTSSGTGSGSGTPTPSTTGTSSGTGSESGTGSGTPSTTLSAVGTPSPTATSTPSPSSTTSSTPSATPSSTLSAGASASNSDSLSLSPTTTPSSTGTQSPTPSSTPSVTTLALLLSTSPTPSPTSTGSSSALAPTLALGASPSSFLIPSASVTQTPTAPPSPSSTVTPSTTLSGSTTLSASSTSSLTRGSSPSNTGSISLTSTPSPSPLLSTPTPSTSPSPLLPGIVTPSPTSTPSSSISLAPPLTALSPSQTPTVTTVSTPTISPSPTASMSPGVSATGTPTPSSSSGTGTGTTSRTPSTTVSLSTTISSSPTSSLTKGASPSVSSSPSTSPSLSPTETPTSSGSGTPSGTVSASPTASLSRGASPSITPSASSTLSLSSTPSLSGTSSSTPSGSSGTPTSSLTSGSSPSSTGSNSFTSSPTQTPTASVTNGASGSTSSTNSLTASPTATPTASVSLGLSASTSSTSTLTASPSPTPSSSTTLGASPSTTSTATLSASPTSTPTSSLTQGASSSSISTSTLTSSPSATPTSSLSKGASSSSTSTSSLTSSPTATPSSSITLGASASTTSTSTLTASPSQTPTASLSVGLSPSASSASTLSGSPTSSPTPSLTLGASPSGTSTSTLTGSPTQSPTASLSRGSSPSTSSTATLSASPTGTPSPTLTMGASPSTSSTTTLSSSPTPTPTATLSPGASSSTSSSQTLSSSPTGTPTATLSMGATPSTTSSRVIPPSVSPPATLSLGASPSTTPSYAGSGGISSSGSGSGSGRSSITSTSTSTPSSTLGGGLGSGVAAGAAVASASAGILGGSGLSLFFMGTGGILGLSVVAGGVWMAVQRRRRRGGEDTFPLSSSSSSSSNPSSLSSPKARGRAQGKLGKGGLIKSPLRRSSTAEVDAHQGKKPKGYTDNPLWISSKRK